MTRAGLITTAIIIAACCVPEYGHAATPHKLAPAVPCTMKNRMDFFVDEDHILWECTCEVLKTGHICRWQVIGGVDAIALRKPAKRHVIRYALPPVTA
jgi:hypothetical protein